MGINQKLSSQLHLVNYDAYDDYLDAFVTTMDCRYLRNMQVCRKLISLNYRSSTDVYTAQQFRKQRAIIRELLHPSKKTTLLLSSELNSLDPVLLELAARELPNYQKILSTIVFLTHRSKDGFEVSSFFDLDASFAKANLNAPGHTKWGAIFNEKAKLRPTPHDLSYYDEHKGIVVHNNSDNYIVGHDAKYGLNFMHRGDHKIIYVDNTLRKVEQNYLRSVVFSPKYGFTIFYDHIVRKKI